MKNVRMAVLAFLMTAALMTIYQVGKFYLLEGEYSIWQSHIMTIVFTSLIATIVALSMMNWMERLNRRKAQIELREARLRTLQVTMHTVHHIVNNFLNRLLLLRIESEEEGKISEESLRKLEADIASVSQDLVELSNLEDVAAADEYEELNKSD